MAPYMVHWFDEQSEARIDLRCTRGRVPAIVLPRTDGQRRFTYRKRVQNLWWAAGDNRRAEL